MRLISLETVSGGVGELFWGSLPTLLLELVNVVHVNQCKYKYPLLASLYKVSQPD